MKILKNIISYILVVVLIVAVFGISAINIAENTALSEEYVLSKMEEENYFSNIYEDAISAFESYLPQSGLEDLDISDIISEEKVKEDTQIIIGNIYNGTDTEIDVTDIKTNFEEKVNEWVTDQNVTIDDEALTQLIEVICTEYKDALSDTKYESTIYTYIEKINSYVEMVKTATIVGIVVCVVLIALVNIKSFGNTIAKYGIALTSSGALLIIVNKYVNSQIKISGLTILNESFSIALRSILNDILGKFLNYGVIICVAGVVLIVISAIITSRNIKEKSNKKEKANINEKVSKTEKNKKDEKTQETEGSTKA